MRIYRVKPESFIERRSSGFTARMRAYRSSFVLSIGDRARTSSICDKAIGPVSDTVAVSNTGDKFIVVNKVPVRYNKIYSRIE